MACSAPTGLHLPLYADKDKREIAKCLASSCRLDIQKSTSFNPIFVVNPGNKGATGEGGGGRDGNNSVLREMRIRD